MRYRTCLRLVDLVADASEPLENQPANASSPEGRGAVLYVGGRRNMLGKMRAIGQSKGISVLFHDGGIEDNLSLLPALVGQAGSIVFPVSHSAAGLVKRLCRESDKRYLPCVIPVSRASWRRLPNPQPRTKRSFTFRCFHHHVCNKIGLSHVVPVSSIFNGIYCSKQADLVCHVR